MLKILIAKYTLTDYYSIFSRDGSEIVIRLQTSTHHFFLAKKNYNQINLNIDVIGTALSTQPSPSPTFKNDASCLGIIYNWIYINIIFIPRYFIDCNLSRNTNYYSSYRFRAQIFTNINRSRSRGRVGGDVDHL